MLDSAVLAQDDDLGQMVQKLLQALEDRVNRNIAVTQEHCNVAWAEALAQIDAKFPVVEQACAEFFERFSKDLLQQRKRIDTIESQLPSLDQHLESPLNSPINGLWKQKLETLMEDTSEMESDELGSQVEAAESILIEGCVSSCEGQLADILDVVSDSQSAALDVAKEVGLVNANGCVGAVEVITNQSDASKLTASTIPPSEAQCVADFATRLDLLSEELQMIVRTIALPHTPTLLECMKAVALKLAEMEQTAQDVRLRVEVMESQLAPLTDVKLISATLTARVTRLETEVKKLIDYHRSVDEIGGHLHKGITKYCRDDSFSV